MPPSTGHVSGDVDADKPADGTGSAGVTVVTDPETLEPAWHAARQAQAMYGMPRDERVLVQEHISGSESARRYHPLVHHPQAHHQRYPSR